MGEIQSALRLTLGIDIQDALYNSDGEAEGRGEVEGARGGGKNGGQE